MGTTGTGAVDNIKVVLYRVGQTDGMLQYLEEFERCPTPCAAAVDAQHARRSRGRLDADTHVIRQRSAQDAFVDVEEPWISRTKVAKDADARLAHPMLTRETVLGLSPEA